MHQYSDIMVLLLDVYQSYIDIVREGTIVMCCVAILVVILLVTSLPQHEAITDKRVPYNILAEANVVAEFNNNNICFPRHHWKSFQENKVIRYNQSNCTKAELLTCYRVSAKL